MTYSVKQLEFFVEALAAQGHPIRLELLSPARYICHEFRTPPRILSTLELHDLLRSVLNFSALEKEIYDL